MVPRCISLAVLLASGSARGTRFSSDWKDIEAVENEFLSVPAADSARSSLKFLTSEDHVAGTEGDWVMAHFMETKLAAALGEVTATLPAATAASHCH